MGLSNYVPNSRIAQPGVCTSTTRPATPYEGQVIYETDTNRVLVWDASAWVMIADTDQPPGLQLVKTQTVGTAVSSVTVSDAFSSEWDNYRITYTGGSGSTGAALMIQLGSTTTGYYSTTVYFGYPSADGGSALGVKDNNNSRWTYVGHASTVGAKLSADLFAPNLATRTSFAAGYNEFGTTNNAGHTSGYLNDATQYTAFTMTTSTGTITGGTIRVYGYRN